MAAMYYMVLFYVWKIDYKSILRLENWLQVKVGINCFNILYNVCSVTMIHYEYTWSQGTPLRPQAITSWKPPWLVYLMWLFVITKIHGQDQGKYNNETQFVKHNIRSSRSFKG